MNGVLGAVGWEPVASRSCGDIAAVAAASASLSEVEMRAGKTHMAMVLSEQEFRDRVSTTLSRILREIFSKLGYVFTGGRPVRIAGIAVEY
jgi:hypothetical protein